MANTIATFKQYVPMLDEVYKNAALTSVLDGAAELATQGKNAGELVIPMMEMDGLANYSRNSGYVNGNVTLTYETKKCNFDRGRMFSIDNMDNAETAGIAYGRLAAEFIRTKVVPELDAFRFAAYASAEGVSSATGSLASGANVVTALRDAVTKMDEDEVPVEERYLFITPTLGGMIDDLDTTKSRAILSRFAKVIHVPQTRFYTIIDQVEGGFMPNGKEINFMIVHKPAVIQFQKHVAPKVVSPEQNQNADAWKFGYRNVGIAEAYENKVAGIFVHHKA